MRVAEAAAAGSSGQVMFRAGTSHVKSFNEATESKMPQATNTST